MTRCGTATGLLYVAYTGSAALGQIVSVYSPGNGCL